MYKIEKNNVNDDDNNNSENPDKDKDKNKEQNDYVNPYTMFLIFILLVLSDNTLSSIVTKA